MKSSDVLAIPKGTKIGRFVVKGLGKSRSESALVYLIRNNKGGKPNEKRICESEWKAAIRHLKAHGDFTIDAFRKSMRNAALDGDCNFRFACGVFGHLGWTQQKQRLSNAPVAGDADKVRLIPELVPRPLWGRSAFRMFKQNAKWKQIRAEALADCNNCCSICELASERLSCHEEWEYDDSNGVATLVGFAIHCSHCDAVTHFGQAVNRGPREETLQAILNHLCNVNKCTIEAAQAILMSAFNHWQRRNEKEWGLKVAAPILERYPELAPLPDFIPLGGH